jgi:hypothetical protein
MLCIQKTINIKMDILLKMLDNRKLSYLLLITNIMVFRGEFHSSNIGSGVINISPRKQTLPWNKNS